MRKSYEQIKKFITKKFIDPRKQQPADILRKAQFDANALKNTLETTGWAKLSERLSESFVDGLHELFARLRDGNYDRDKLLVQTGIILARLELINTIDLILEDGRTATEELEKQARTQSTEEMAQN